MLQLVCKRQDTVRTVPMICAAACIPQPESCVSWCGQGLSDGKKDPGRGQLLAVKRQYEGIGVRSSTTGNVFRRSYKNISDFSRRSYRSTSLGHHRSKILLLSGMQGGCLHSNLLPYQPASWLHGH